MWRRLLFHKKQEITPDQVEMKKNAQLEGRRAKQELAEAKELAGILREIREKNHFADSFRRALGGNSGT